MRWLVFFLIVLNVLAFVWFTFERDKQARMDRQDEVGQFNFAGSPTLSLLSELPAAELSSRDIRVKKPVVATSVAGDMCLLLGAFPEVVSAKQAKGRLSKAALTPKVVEVLKILPAISWVYVKPRQNRKKALAVLKRLQSENIDSFLITDGDYENGISLGFFSNKAAAEETMHERRNQGYDVSVTLRSREQKTYWLAFGASQSADMTDEMIGGFAIGFAIGLPVVSKQEKTCEEVALLASIE